MKIPRYLEVTGPHFNAVGDGTYKAYANVRVKRWGVFPLGWRAIRNEEFPIYRWPIVLFCYLRVCFKVLIKGF